MPVSLLFAAQMPTLLPAKEQCADEGVDDAHDDRAGPEGEAEAAAVVRPDEHRVSDAGHARAGVGLAAAVRRTGRRHFLACLQIEMQ